MQMVKVKTLNYSATSAEASFFLLVSFVTLSNISGTRLTALSTALSLETMCLIVTSPSLTTRNATGLIVMPAPPAPPKSSTL